LELIELLDLIRRPYVTRLSQAATEADCHVEPAMCGSDGIPVRDGVLDVPCRYDLVRRDTGTPSRIDAAAQILLDPLRIALGGAVLSISAFSWDGLTLDVSGMSEADTKVLMRNWFLGWFDEDDANPQNGDGLYGVVHFISDPVQVEDALRFQIDLGSAPAESLSELLGHLLSQGATTLALG
jgi:hypothetical protein